MTSKSAALAIGIIFIVVGLLGFVENPIVGEHDAIFHTDQTHNLVHIVSGVLFVLFALAAPAHAATFMIIFGIVYLGLGIWGMASIGDDGMTTLLGFLKVNGNDNYLHIGLGLVILLAAMSTRGRVDLNRRHR